MNERNNLINMMMLRMLTMLMIMVTLIVHYYYDDGYGDYDELIEVYEVDQVVHQVVA
jgi:hypothetical protein